MSERDRVGSFATGYEQIRQKVWVCPIHGEVSDWAIAAGWDHRWWHIRCGHYVDRRERLASAPPFER